MSLGNCRYCGRKWIYVKSCNDCGDICCDKCATNGTGCVSCNSTNRSEFVKNSEKKQENTQYENEEVIELDSFDRLGERYAHFKGVMSENWDTLTEEEKKDRISKMDMIIENGKGAMEKAKEENDRAPLLVRVFGWLLFGGLILILFAMFPIFTIIVGILAAIGYFCKDK